MHIADKNTFHEVVCQSDTEVKWYFNNNDLPRNVNTEEITLTIHNVDSTTAGKYYCYGTHKNKKFIACAKVYLRSKSIY